MFLTEYFQCQSRHQDLARNLTSFVISLPTAPPSRLSRILVVKADRLCTDAFAHIVQKLFPEAEVLVARRLVDANAAIASGPFDLMITGIELPDGDTLDFIAAVTSKPIRIASVLVVTGHCESRILESLRTLPIKGMCDSRNDGLDEIEQALRSIAEGKPHWSSSALTALQGCVTATTIHRLLTPTEQLTFSILGDGCDDEVAAEKLNLTAASVGSLRREIHRKLKLQHRGELMRLAVQTGFVRISKTGIFRPAFATMLSLCSSRKIPRAGLPVTLEAPSASCAII